MIDDRLYFVPISSEVYGATSSGQLGGCARCFLKAVIWRVHICQVPVLVSRLMKQGSVAVSSISPPHGEQG